MWNLYNELYMGIPSGIRIESCIVGKLWTTVRANGNVGVAHTLGDPGGGADALGQSMAGQYLRDAANCLRWDNPVRASAGVAALNAFYNTAARLESLNAPPPFQNELDGKRAAVIGELPNLEKGLRERCTLTALPLPEGEVLDSAYDAALAGDFVFISGDALTSRVLPALLERVGPDAKVSLAGVSVPAAPVLFGFGRPIHNLSGFYVRFGTTVEAAAQRDIADLAPGVLPFSVGPAAPRRLHESPEITRYQASPYKASAFNSAFNPWEGRDCDQSAWPPIFKG